MKPKLFRRDYALNVADEIASEIERGGNRVIVTGSIRRNKPSVKDIDLVVETRQFAGVSFPEHLRLIRGGENYRQYDCELSNGRTIAVDVWRCADPEQWGGFVLFSTGSADYNVRLRHRAKTLGLRLNQSGLWRDDRHLPLCERGIVDALGLPYLSPAQREIYNTKREES